MKKRPTYHGANGKFSSKAKARYVKSAGKIYQLPRGKKAREKVIARAEKRATKPTFSDKIKKQGVRVGSSQPTHARYFSESKTLNVPGSLDKTFEIEKFIYLLNEPAVFTSKNIHKVVRNLKNNAYPKFLETYDNVKESGVFIEKGKKGRKGPNYLFRIDTAYVNETDDFAKVDGVYKKDKDGLSDGRGFSIGRYLEITTKKRFIQYLNATFDAFLKSLETYLARKGIRAGQINALILEVS